MKAIAVILIFLLFGGCSLKNGAIFGAHKRYTEGKYEEAISKALQASAKYDLTDEESAQLHYIIAQSYEQLGELEKAISMHMYIRDNYPETKYAYLSKGAIKKLR